MKLILTLLLTVSLSAVAYSQTTAPYQDPSLEPEQRALDLLGRLTLEQKVALMSYNSPEIPELGIRKYNWWNEALHGSARNGLATVFPQAIGMAASWNNELLQQVFDVASTEQRIKFDIAREGEGVQRYHGLTVWTPNINIFRDPRWGRGHETYGEDPYLTGRMGVAFIKGLQNSGAEHLRTAACAKHLAVHSGPEDTRHGYNVNVTEKDLWETYLPAFEKTVTIISWIALVVWVVFSFVERTSKMLYAELITCIAIGVVCVCEAILLWKVK